MLSHTMRSRWMQLTASACLMMAVATPAWALTGDSITVDMTNFTGDDLWARAVLEQTSDNDIKVTLSTVQEGTYINTGDWSAFWFNIADDSFLAGMTVVGDDVTAYDFSGSVEAVGSNSNNLNGAGSPGMMDAGIAFGQPGSADGLLQVTMFTLSHTDGLSLSLFMDQIFAGRLMSVGPAPDGGDGSSKVVNGDNPVPEPVSAALVLMGIGSLGLGRRRSR